MIRIPIDTADKTSYHRTIRGNEHPRHKGKMMTVKQIETRKTQETAICEAAAKIRQIIDETLTTCKDLDGDRDIQEEILNLVTEE